MEISFRPASASDFDYCRDLYLAGMEAVIRQMNRDRSAEIANLRGRWQPTEVRIITVGGADVGWLQIRTECDAVFLAQLFVDGSWQRQGIGTQVMHRLIEEAGTAARAVTLGVVKTNPALRLYQRLGFRITHQDDRKFYMRRQASPAPTSRTGL